MVAELTALARVVDFLSSQPTDQDIMDLKATTAEEERIDHLSRLKNDGKITSAESEELHNALLAEYMMGIAKAKAYGRQSGQTHQTSNS